MLPPDNLFTAISWDDQSWQKTKQPIEIEWIEVVTHEHFN